MDSLPGSLLLLVSFKYVELMNRLGAEGTDMGAAMKDVLNFLLAEAGCDANMAIELVLVVKFGIFRKRRAHAVYLQVEWLCRTCDRHSGELRAPACASVAHTRTCVSWWTS